MRLYKFDKCLSDYQHSKGILDETNALLRTWFIASKSMSPKAYKFCFLFGSSSTGKSEELNLVNSHSIIQHFLRELKEPLKLLKVSMFF